jgi:RNA polymerase sigma-70 factor (ECF subfamily)
MTVETRFEDQLVAELPSLRAFARTLTRDVSRADDLTQQAVLKAWANRERFQLGTNMRAWLFTILRNTFYSEFRKRRNEVGDPDGEHAMKLASRPTQDHGLTMGDFVRAMARLNDNQREALVLVGAAGLSYEEAAAVMGVAVGTAKSRVSRARELLAAWLEIEDGAGLFADGRIDAAMGGGVISPAA